ncbi:TraR/DksA family transcriptional regulator [Micromonospora citrea]|uniref:TraR/DksA family transcriptional regulator n=1 Tax=Micromonospora citrea TaxID=47855 RepID=UPI003C4CB7B1
MGTDVDVADDRWLRGVRAALTAQFEEQTARLTQLTADTGDPGEVDTHAALVAATRRGLEQVTGALTRLAEGRYGVCEGCAAPMPRERLEVLPHARFCVPCQSRRGR